MHCASNLLLRVHFSTHLFLSVCILFFLLATSNAMQEWTPDWWAKLKSILHDVWSAFNSFAFALAIPPTCGFECETETKSPCECKSYIFVLHSTRHFCFGHDFFLSSFFSEITMSDAHLYYVLLLFILFASFIYFLFLTRFFGLLK